MASPAVAYTCADLGGSRGRRKIFAGTVSSHAEVDVSRKEVLGIPRVSLPRMTMPPLRLELSRLGVAHRQPLIVGYCLTYSRYAMHGSFMGMRESANRRRYSATP